MVETIGFTPSQLLPANALLRLTFVKDTSIFSPDFGYDVFFDTWPAKMSSTWSRLPNQAGLFTITPANVGPNATATTIDARTHTARSGQDIINAVEAMQDSSVSLQRLELLGGATAAAATSNDGAAARDAATAGALSKQAASSLGSRLSDALAGTSAAVKWGAAAVVLVLLLLVVFRAEKK